MSKEQQFYNLCKGMAAIEDVITAFQNIGLLVEPGNGKTHDVASNLYETASIMYRIASDLLEYPDVTTENEICNTLLSANSETMKEISKEVWDKYGVK